MRTKGGRWRRSYERVSTGDQETEVQRDAFNSAGCAKIFEDHASGVKADRPRLAEAIAYARDGDTLTVWSWTGSADRLFISRLRNAFYTRLSDFDEMTDMEMLRDPAINWRNTKAVRAERAGIDRSQIFPMQN